MPKVPVMRPGADRHVGLSSGWPSSQNQPPRYFTDGFFGSGTGVFASTAARNGSALSCGMNPRWSAPLLSTIFNLLSEMPKEIVWPTRGAVTAR